jgi:hypothetical protein
MKFKNHELNLNRWDVNLFSNILSSDISYSVEYMESLS